MYIFNNLTIHVMAYTFIIVIHACDYSFSVVTHFDVVCRQTFVLWSYE